MAKKRLFQKLYGVGTKNQNPRDAYLRLQWTEKALPVEENYVVNADLKGLPESIQNQAVMAFMDGNYDRCRELLGGRVVTMRAGTQNGLDRRAA